MSPSENILDLYRRNTPKSQFFAEEAKKIMPGGVTANIKSFDPYPIVMQSGKGAYLSDIDGNRYIDYLLSYGALMLGHGHPAIAQAVQKQMENDGTVLFGTPHPKEVEMAKRIQQYYPSMEMIRYTNSGTEATLLATRMAFAYTGKFKIAKFEGHYHGGYNEVLLSVNPSITEAGPAHAPRAVADSKGIAPHQVENTIILPFNHLEACEEILTKRQHEIAAVMIEPVQAGFIPAEQAFMDGLRKVTEELGILLIFDEVKTGFRMGIGGAQSVYGIQPDLTALGKVIGGGFPIGIIGGKKQIMMVSSPLGASDVFDNSTSHQSSAKEVLFHSGTYNGHPTILAVGLAVIEVLEQEMDRVLNLTENLKKGIRKLFESRGIPIQTLGLGSIFNIVITEKDRVQNYRDLQQSDFALRKEIDFHLLTEGIYSKPLNRYSLSTAHGEKEVNDTLEAYDKVLSQKI